MSGTPHLAVCEASSAPDVLLIMPDQMRGDCLSALGHPVVRTPQMDKLAEEGVLFQRAYATVASCIPARYALMTGLYPQTSGVVGFEAKPFSTPPLPGLLSEIGYATALVGRDMHQVPECAACGYQKRIIGSTFVDNDDYGTFLREAAPETGGIHALIETMGLTCNLWQADPWPLANELHPTEWVITHSRNILKEAQKEKPLFLTTSFYAPHPPLFPPREYFDACHERKLPSPAFGDWVDRSALSTQGDAEGHRVLLEGDVLHNAQAGYFGLIEHIDNQIASLISEFKARSRKNGRSWAIVLTSDHGEMLGDHGFFRKCEPYEGSANIPLIISASPELGFQSGQHLTQPVCLEDIMPTLLALAGTDCPACVDGINLTPALRGEKQMVREWLHFEHAPCYSEAQAYHALTDGHFKYIWRPTDGSEQLFDRDNDPHEERDLSRVRTHGATLAMWRARLAERLSNRPEAFSEAGQLVPGRPYPALNAGTMSIEEQTRRVLQ
ncbi:MAG: sulfatase-like hydrolase/transferase [Candidatus Pacebacteria bacterium]|nr:sulfatase-like hydrolase/transferase [Candidatus Paceibacterota bacterium]